MRPRLGWRHDLSAPELLPDAAVLPAADYTGF